MTSDMFLLAILCVGVVFCTLCVLRRFIPAMINSAVGGWLAVGAVNLASTFTGITLTVNIFSGAITTLLGIPGVISMLLLQVFW